MNNIKGSIVANGNVTNSNNLDAEDSNVNISIINDLKEFKRSVRKSSIIVSIIVGVISSLIASYIYNYFFVH